MFGFRSSCSMSDADWCYDDSLTAPLFARLRQLDCFKQRLLSLSPRALPKLHGLCHQHCHPILVTVVDSPLPGDGCWLLFDLHIGHPRNHLVYCFGSWPIQITIPHLCSSHKLTSTCTLKCTPSVPCSFMETPSTVAALLLFWGSHSFSFSKLIGGTHAVRLTDSHGGRLLLFSSSGRHTPSSVCCS